MHQNKYLLRFILIHFFISSRLQQTQLSDTSRLSEENNTVAEATQVLPEPTEVPEASETMHETQDVVPEISQRLNRKRKRQM